MIDPPPLSLYVHVPWCVRKCPYCDFNSHAVKSGIPERTYVDALLADLDLDLPMARGRPLVSIFIGGGTPSLLSGAAIQRLLGGVRERIPGVPDMEITLEANPGTVEVGHFAAYREAGVNRLSLGVQSLQAAQLQALGRIHGADEAIAAVETARRAGFANLNLDLMFGLPGQGLDGARADLVTALDLAPEHLSYYQLTLEPNTPFHARPPALPEDDLIGEIQDQGQALLSQAGFSHYEVSAYARPGRECRHNLNYWEFGDYLGIGAGAHAKLTLTDGRVLRRWKHRHPDAYLRAAVRGDFVAGTRELGPADLRIEFLMNALRLPRGCSRRLFEARTGQALGSLEPGLTRARDLGLMEVRDDRLSPTERGLGFLNDLLACF